MWAVRLDPTFWHLHVSVSNTSPSERLLGSLGLVDEWKASHDFADGMVAWRLVGLVVFFPWLEAKKLTFIDL